MSEIENFKFDRSRGLVWVCDVKGSSRYLNDDASADELETFLPRLYWIASAVVTSAGGRFVKWTGDGFLAWFETPLHRDMGKKAATIFEAIELLSMLVERTQLGTSPERRFEIRHGLTYELDALLTAISHLDGGSSLDIMGRAVVLAFRLSSLKAPFPGVAVQGEVVEAYRRLTGRRLSFKKWNPGADGLARYFKKERWGTASILLSMRAPSATALQKNTFGWQAELQKEFEEGPSWCRKILSNCFLESA